MILSEFLEDDFQHLRDKRQFVCNDVFSLFRWILISSSRYIDAHAQRRQRTHTQIRRDTVYTKSLNMHFASFGDAGHYSIRCLLRCFKSLQRDCLHSIERCPFLEERKKWKKKIMREIKSVLFFRCNVPDHRQARGRVEFRISYVVSWLTLNKYKILESHKSRQVYDKMCYMYIVTCGIKSYFCH